MFKAAKDIDSALLVWGNSFHNPFFDRLMPWLTNPLVWLPLFVWWFYEVYHVHGRKLWQILVCIAVLIFATDRSSVLIKDSVKRYRPTHNLLIKDKVHVVNDYRGGEYGYVSSHAANSFALAFFLFFMLKPSNRLTKASIFGWALLFCYTRIYLGVHYPFDLLSGALLGTLWAFIFYNLYNRFFA